MNYDMIIIGGGLAGCSLAKVMAEAGARTLVLEREKHYRDRVRGEGIHPWGVAEARLLGIYDPLINSCGHEVRWWYGYDENLSREQRDLFETTPHHAGSLNFHHPEMQEVLLQAAESAGAEIKRGAVVTGITPGALPKAHVKMSGTPATHTARLIVGADGRTAKSRQWAGFQVNRDPDQQITASMLVENLDLDEDGVHAKFNVAVNQLVIIFPVGGGRFRIYFAYRIDGKRRGFSGRQQMDNFIDACITAGTPASWYAHSRPIGPLAEYSGAASWVDRPYRNGIVLVGDAAGAVDPCWGCGMSLTLRDVRVLSQELIASNDWGEASQIYAESRERYYGDLHRIEQWHALLMYESGAEADARRARAFSKKRENIPDILGLGPDSPCDESARRRFFGEE